MSLAYLSEIERGRKEASSEVLAAICRALGLRLVDLLAQVYEELARLEPTISPPLPRPPAVPVPPDALASPPDALVAVRPQPLRRPRVELSSAGHRPAPRPIRRRYALAA